MLECGLHTESSSDLQKRDNPSARLDDARRRRLLHDGSLVEVIDCYVPAEGPFSDGYEPKFQICLPYFGVFSYAVGRRSWLMDGNQSLFISPGWEAEEEHPLRGFGHAAILLNPAPDLLEEICGASGPLDNSAFERGAVPASARLKLLTQQLLRRADETVDALEIEEWALATLRESLSVQPPRGAAGSSKVVNRAKELLHAHSGERLLLDQMARAVGVSPVYLTQEFARREGVPLYRYQLQLRLAKALLELPHCNDITGLALDLGFSSHSHFTSSFRRAFELTPAQYRSTIGTRGMPYSTSGALELASRRMRRTRSLS